MDTILSAVKCQFDLVCLHLLEVCNRASRPPTDCSGTMSKVGVSLKLKTCLFFEDFIDYLSHVVPPARLGILTTATNAICELQNPTNVTKLKSSLGRCNVLRHFVSSFTCVDASFQCKLQQEQPYHFGRLKETEMEALETLQQRLLSPLKLALPRSKG